jgi:hypothetical protein
MRTSTDQNPATGAPSAVASEWAVCTAADSSSPLLELARVERGFRFYPETDARRMPLAERARIGTRLAGELQNPDVLPMLIRALRVP